MSDQNPEEEKTPEEFPVEEGSLEEVETPEEGEAVEEEMAAGEEPAEAIEVEETFVTAEPEAEFVEEEVEAGAPEEPEAYLPPPQRPYEAAVATTTSEERTWALLSHLSILLNLITGFLGPVVALIIYFVFRERSRYVAYQAFQSFIFQLIFWVGAGALIGISWLIVGVLSVVVIGLCLIPLACLVTLLPIFALGYGIVGAIKTGQGEDFRYWLVGDWVRDIYTG